MPGRLKSSLDEVLEAIRETSKISGHAEEINTSIQQHLEQIISSLQELNEASTNFDNYAKKLSSYKRLGSTKPCKLICYSLIKLQFCKKFSQFCCGYSQAFHFGGLAVS